MLQSGVIHLFRAFGINVYLHWSWLLVALIEFQSRSGVYRHPAWPIFEYLTLFGLVLLHEFGHSLACRSVGGAADRIVLWPLGGVAFVRPPARPGATLWSIAAGPLVNVLLMPLLFALYYWSQTFDPVGYRDLQVYFFTILAINTVLLVFNLLPIYPLDGGQILQSILWFFLGWGRSLQIAAGIGLAAAVVVAAAALWASNYWLIILAVFVGWQAWRGLQLARYLRTLEARDDARLTDLAARLATGADEADDSPSQSRRGL